MKSLPKSLYTYQVELLESRQLIFHYAPSNVTSGEILNAISDAGLTITDISTKETKLEDIFVKSTKEVEALNDRLGAYFISSFSGRVTF